MRAKKTASFEVRVRLRVRVEIRHLQAKLKLLRVVSGSTRWLPAETGALPCDLAHTLTECRSADAVRVLT